VHCLQRRCHIRTYVAYSDVARSWRLSGSSFPTASKHILDIPAKTHRHYYSAVIQYTLGIGLGSRYTNKADLHSVKLVSEWVHHIGIQQSHSRPLSLAIPWWVGAKHGFIQVHIVHLSAPFDGQPCQGRARFSVLAHPSLELQIKFKTSDDIPKWLISSCH